MRCRICNKKMRKFHYNSGNRVLFETYQEEDDSYSMDRITEDSNFYHIDLTSVMFPQPTCKKCFVAFKKWVKERKALDK